MLKILNKKTLNKIKNYKQRHKLTKKKNKINKIKYKEELRKPFNKNKKTVMLN